MQQDDSGRRLRFLQKSSRCSDSLPFFPIATSYSLLDLKSPEAPVKVFSFSLISSCCFPPLLFPKIVLLMSYVLPKRGPVICWLIKISLFPSCFLFLLKYSTSHSKQTDRKTRRWWSGEKLLILLLLLPSPLIIDVFFTVSQWWFLSPALFFVCITIFGDDNDADDDVYENKRKKEKRWQDTHRFDEYDVMWPLRKSWTDWPWFLRKRITAAHVR